MANEKPNDWLESFATKTFPAGTTSVDVADVSKDADKDKLLFGQPGAPADGEPEDDTFVWDESDEVVKKHGQGMWRTDVVVGTPPNAKTYRYWGKTRTEVTKALIKAQQNAVPTIDELKRKVTEISAAPPSGTRPLHNLVPDTKLPYDPIKFQQPRTLSDQEVLQLTEMAQTDPIKAQRVFFQAMTGCTPEALIEAIRRIDSMFSRRIADEAAFAFQADHADDWEATPGNTALIDAYLKERNWPVTKTNLEIAFQDLVAQRRLTMPTPEPDETPVLVPAAATPTVEEVSPPPPPVLIPTGGAPRSVAKTEADLVREAAAGIREMPLDEARASLVDAFRRQRGAR